MNAKEYFWANVLQSAEFEDKEDGHRFWSDAMNPDALHAYVEQKKPFYYLSDIDFLADDRQPNSFVRRVMKLADLNFYKNPAWCKKNHITGYHDAIDFICDNGLWRVEAE